MLGLMRKHAGNWMIKILLGAIAIAFALSWGVYNYGEGPRRVAVKINGEAIADSRVNEVYVRLVEEAKQQLGNQFDRVAPLLNLRQRALDELVNQVLLSQAASDLAVQVGDIEVQARLAATPIFQRNGRFDVRLYRRILAQNRFTPERFEAEQRQVIRMEKLTSLVAGTAQVTPLELNQALAGSLARVKGVYQVFKPGDYEDEVKPSAAQIKKFYEENQNRYLEPAKVKFDYIIFPLSAQRDQVQVSDDEVAETYDVERERFSKPETVAARHILFKLPAKATPAEVSAAKEKAEKVLALAKKPDADFAALAKQYSQGPTATRGGDLGSFQRGQMVAPFEELAFSLKPGEVGLVKTRFGWHVIKVYRHDPASLTPLKEVAGEIKAALVERRSRELAQAAAERAFDKAAMGTKLADLAKAAGTSVLSSPRVAQGQPIEGLPGLKDFFAAAQDLNPGQAVPAVPFENGSVLAVITERVEEKPKPLEQVEAKARQAVLEKLAREKARQEADRLIKDLSGTKDPAAELARMPGAAQTGWLKRDDMIKGLTGSTEVVGALFLRPAGAPLVPKPVASGDDFVAAVLEQRQEADAKEIKEKQASFKEALLAEQRRQVMQGFLDDLKARAEILVPVDGAPGDSAIPGCDSPGSTKWVPMGSPQAQAR